ncbi:MAG: hypothetical protein EP350_06290 [Alphaproteobacteria bacterium]|nr:MAG: hypothetical protein EP350_06290 [Alphaproteobacteria bacterium]
MNWTGFAAASTAALALVAQPLAAQDVEEASTAAAAPEVEAQAAKPCELHVWPTENYLGIKMGLFSGFGAVGAVIDQAGHKKGVQTVKDLMREYLGPEVQLAELEKLDYMGKLKLSPEEYAVIVHEPTPWNEDLKKNPELKAEVKALNKKIKDGKRITDSANPCYAELITTHIFYHKAMMYGSNLFTGWQLRRFDGDTLLSAGIGQVKNPLEDFPPKDETMVEAAQVELRDAYAKDFVEWVEKKSGA